ncbi:hypothetical protein lerEdw1_007259 [Lerista edwardsae]|nr:hypothetical protein lerEdw1_007259 [Lerista edwardsae]
MAPRRAPLALQPVLLLLLLGAVMAARTMPGGLMPQPVTDPGVQKAARFALSAYNQASNSLYYSRALRIVSAQTQVVAGLKYYLTVELVNTQCKKQGGVGLTSKALDHCALPPENEQTKQICEFEVWSRPWLKDTQLLKMDCKPS